jgi:ABC-type sugar transport system ATPase subunit
MDSTPESTDPATSGNGHVGNAGSGVESSESKSLLSLRGISKNFGPVQALQDCDLDVPAGEVTALLGDNGAGKSTFIKCVSGIYAPSAGKMYWRGTEVHVHTPRDAAALGIATVYQDLALCDNLDIVENMYLGREETKLGMLDETFPLRRSNQFANSWGRFRVANAKPSLSREPLCATHGSSLWMSPPPRSVSRKLNSCSN